MDKRYNHNDAERSAQQLWNQEKTYAFLPEKTKPLYSIDTPPPTVSGSLHIGHVFSYVHTDLIARYKRMTGHNVYYPMGFDDNGLPTERFVEKKNQTKAHLVGRSAFIKLCQQEALLVEQDFQKLWNTLALSVDWDQLYTTISASTRKASQYSFIDLLNKKFVYRKYEPALYCTTCKTSVAQAELDSSDVSTTFNDIIFTDEDGNEIVIATTRPELLPACVAVFAHPSDSRYQHLLGKSLLTPIYNKKVTVMADEKVDPEKGSGIVMCCTFGDQTDIHWFKIHKLDLIEVVGKDGLWTAAAGPLEGLRVIEARKKILALLEEAGKLKAQKKISHNVNVHERCKQEIEFIVLTQWFINIMEHKQKFLDLAEQIEWKPTHMKARYIDWVKNLHWDWCISRQRFFGIPFPVWHCDDCSHVTTALLAELPIDPQEEAEKKNRSCTNCSSTKLTPDTDVMDTWNTSSLTPQLNTCWPDKERMQLPMSLRPQAHDIIRTWAFYTIVKSYFHHQSIPWKTIMISGHVLAGRGEKISKSKANEKMTPGGLLKEYSADVIRFWSASGKLGVDTAFSETKLKIGSKLTTKLWNAFRFFKEHINQQQPTATPPKLEPINQWIFHQLGKTVSRYRSCMDQYEYSHALESIEHFFWHDFCDNYLEIIKDQFFNPENYSDEEISATQYSLYECGLGIIQLYAPFIPHITETLYQSIYRAKENVNSIHLTQLSNNRLDKPYPESLPLIEILQQAISAIRKMKSEHHLSLKTTVDNLIVSSNNKTTIQALKTQEKLLKGISKTKLVSFTPTEKEPHLSHTNGEQVIMTIQLY